MAKLPSTHAQLAGAEAEDDTVSVLSYDWSINAKVLHPSLIFFSDHFTGKCWSLDTRLTSLMNYPYVQQYTERCLVEMLQPRSFILHFSSLEEMSKSLQKEGWLTK